MAKPRIWYVAACVMVGGCQAAPSGRLGETQTAEIRTEVQAFLDRYVALLENGEWDSVGTLYADDPRFEWLEDGELRYPTTSMVREALRGAGELLEGGSFQRSDVEIVVLGPNAAHVTSRFSQVYRDTSGAEFPFDGVFSAVVIETEDGWRFLRGHTSSRQRRR